jgi:hypothetical protein
MLTYLLPVVLLTVYMGLLIRRVRIDTGPNLSSLALAAALTLVAGGLSESYMIPQNVGLTLALVAALFSGDRVLPRRVAPYLVAGLLGGVVALALTLVAPATPGRTGGGSADLWLALSAAIVSAFALAIRLIRYFPQVVVLCLALPAVLAHVSPCRRYASTRCALGVLAGTAVLLPFCFFPSFFANNGNPPARALIVPSFLIVVCLSFLGWHVRVVSGQWSSVVSSRSRLALASLILAAVPIGAAVTALPEAASAAQYAAVWDAEDGAIRAARDAGVRNLTVAPLPRYLGEDFVGPDPHDWFNACVARYYGVDSISTG